VYCEILPWDVPKHEVDISHVKGIILSGGPNSVYEEDAPGLPDWVLGLGVPILGICYGMQVLAQALGGRVAPARAREYGLAAITVDAPNVPLFQGLPITLQVWMSHGDRVEELPPGLDAVAHSANSPVAAMADRNRGYYGLQFHPEVVHTPQGLDILRSFSVRICGCARTWTPGAFIDESISRIREIVGKGRVICGVSGGVDSTVVAALVHRAVGDQLTAIFVDNGLLRKDEAAETVTRLRRHLGSKSIVPVNATEEFLHELRGVVDPEEKRRVIGRVFVEIFEEEARKRGGADFLAQGTLYPDVIESATSGNGSAARIKTHHNVGGLPDGMRLRLIEPLRFLFKDEARAVGRALGLPDEVVYRQPFPGPGLAVRIIGEVTRERVEMLREADAIVREEILASGLEKDIWEYFAVLTDLRSVGVMGDGRTYANVVAVRAVSSRDGMTADWARLPHDVLARISGRIVNEVPGVNRVVYDISSKPPATIAWE